MVDKPRIEDVERISLEFAKAMICGKGDEGSTVIDESLIIDATDLAMDWIAGKDLRDSIVEQRYPDWIDLSVKNKKFNIGMGERYWFVAQRLDSDNQAGLPEIIEAKVTDINDRWGVIDVKVEDVVHAIDYKALYFIPENSSKVFTQDFQPMPPQGVKVKNNKFSPTMSSQS